VIIRRSASGSFFAKECPKARQPKKPAAHPNAVTSLIEINQKRENNQAEGYENRMASLPSSTIEFNTEAACEALMMSKSRPPKRRAQ
jgi:hypothetical protein